MGDTMPPHDFVAGTSEEPSEGEVRRVKFGTFQGVFTPTLLTILGVIMYVRSPWVVGNTGVLGAIAIVSIASLITLFTSLSMASIVTNIRIKAGGAFSIISQSLGLEVGGAIGIPLYVAQALAVTMYIFGFREGWQWMFPDHPAIVIDLLIFGLIFFVANISTDFAFKIQYLVLAIIFISLVSIAMGFVKYPVNHQIEWFVIGDVQDSSRMGFWMVFAVFFPAVTGIMAGANMSGDLKSPRTSIPVGTLAAVFLSYLIYVALVVAVAFLATPEELRSNYNILIDRSFLPILVLAGLLGATFSSALSSLVGAPRILQALGQNRILFANDKLAELDQKGEPKIALYSTATLVFLSLLLRDLNAIASLLTMFFLITYAMINVVVLIEQGIGQISFRPTIKLPILVPLLGAVGCFLVMFIINSTIGLISIGLVVAMYIYLSRQKNLESSEGDTRSGMFNSLAEWSTKVVSRFPDANERAWQPNLLVPAKTIQDVVRCYKTLYNLSRPKGSVKILGFDTDNSFAAHQMRRRFPELVQSFMDQNISAATAIVEAESFGRGVQICMQGLKASFFTPNTLFLSITDDLEQDPEYEVLLTKAHQYGFASYLYAPYKKVGLGLEKTINLWIDFRHADLDQVYRVDHINVGLLTAHLLRRNWKGKLHVNAITGAEGVDDMKNYIRNILSNGRLAYDSINFINRLQGHQEDEVNFADLNIITLQAEECKIEELRKRVNQLGVSCLFTIDGGNENALA